MKTKIRALFLGFLYFLSLHPFSRNWIPGFWNDWRRRIRLSERNRNAIIDSSHIYNYSEIGVFLDHVDIHQAMIASSHMSYSKGGANVSFRGRRKDSAKAGLWSIAGNHISNQHVNIHLDSARGIPASGNNFILGRQQVLLIENGPYISVSGNVSDCNSDYYRIGLYPGSGNGVIIRDSDGIIVNSLILDGSAQGSPEVGGAIEISNSKRLTT